MNKRVTFALSVAASLLIQFTAVAQESHPWQKFAPDGETFSVLMPTPISQETQTNPQKPSMKMRTYSSEGEGKFFYISSLDVTGHFLPTTANFESFVKGFLNSYCQASKQRGLSCETVFDRELNLNGRTGKQFGVTIANGERKIEGMAKIYMAGNNFYAIQALGGKEGDVLVDKFLKSFSLVETKSVTR